MLVVRGGPERVRFPRQWRTPIRFAIATRMLWCGQLAVPVPPSVMPSQIKLVPAVAAAEQRPTVVIVAPAPAADYARDVPLAPQRVRVVVIDEGSVYAVTQHGLEPLRRRVAPHPEGVPVLVFASSGTGYDLDFLNGYLSEAGPLLFALSSGSPAGQATWRLGQPGASGITLEVRGGDRSIPLLRSRFSRANEGHPPGTCGIPIRSCTDHESIAEMARAAAGRCRALAFVQTGGRARARPPLHLPVIQVFGRADVSPKGPATTF